MHELGHLYSQLVPGGVLDVDGYRWVEGANRALDRYFDGIDHRPLLRRIDIQARVAINPTGLGGTAFEEVPA